MSAQCVATECSVFLSPSALAARDSRRPHRRPREHFGAPGVRRVRFTHDQPWPLRGFMRLNGARVARNPPKAPTGPLRPTVARLACGPPKAFSPLEPNVARLMRDLSTATLGAPKGERRALRTHNLLRPSSGTMGVKIWPKLKVCGNSRLTF